MIHRQYFVLMPSNAGSMTSIDILPRQVGTMAAPMRLLPAGGTAPPAGWGVFGAVQADGQVAEWRGRPLNFERVAADGAALGFLPRLALGPMVHIASADSGAADGCAPPPSYQLSASLVGTLAVPFNTTQIADPVGIGPVIRLLNNADVQGRTYIVTLAIPEASEDDSGARDGT